MLCIFHIQKSFGRQKTKKSFSLVIIFPYFVFLLWNWLWDIHYTYCMSIVCTIRRMSSIFILLYGVLYRASPHFPISFRWQANKAGKSIAGLTMRIRRASVQGRIYEIFTELYKWAQQSSPLLYTNIWQNCEAQNNPVHTSLWFWELHFAPLSKKRFIVYYGRFLAWGSKKCLIV